jgi:putative acyl-CoA dehydrogenase
VRRAGVSWVEGAAVNLGRLRGIGRGAAARRAREPQPPVLRTHDRYGHRIDEVDYHPSYHGSWSGRSARRAFARVEARQRRLLRARGALLPVEPARAGHGLPGDDDLRLVPVLDHAPSIAATGAPKVLATPTIRARAPSREGGVTIGMAMTEKQGGSRPARGADARRRATAPRYRLDGHKWFCSAPMSDAFFTLARLPEGVTCFFVPRSLPDGTRNAIQLQRLKDKCGNRSNASSEIEYRDALAWIVGEPGRGIATLIEMAHHTRFDIVVGVAGMMRAALNQALHHARHRTAFGKRLVEHALMENVLADLALGSGGRDAARVPPGRGVRRLIRFGERARAAARADADREVLALQAHHARGPRGDGVPRRQRLRRGSAARAPLSARRR